ncbi:MAG: hypothetical protein KJZ83_11420 [Burkholderiaceae bacterium]|nr:hypothetical protein [Burkholderiaceae bacterium]
MNSEHALVLTCDDPNWAATGSPQRLRAALAGIGLPGGVAMFEVFAPHPGHARLALFGDGPPPFTIVEFRAPAPEPLRRLAGDPRLRRALREAGPPSGWMIGLFRVVSEALPQPKLQPTATATSATEVPLALLVHYYGPTDDPGAFAAHYVAHHPAILARLPRVREVLCYLPAGPVASGLPQDPTVIRNEVRFDSMDDLLAALRSSVMTELRADTKAFPRFGRSTHYPMLRG